MNEREHLSTNPEASNPIAVTRRFLNEHRGVRMGIAAFSALALPVSAVVAGLVVEKANPIGALRTQECNSTTDPHDNGYSARESSQGLPIFRCTADGYIIYSASPAMTLPTSEQSGFPPVAISFPDNRTAGASYFQVGPNRTEEIPEPDGDGVLTITTNGRGVTRVVRHGPLTQEGFRNFAS